MRVILAAIALVGTLNQARAIDCPIGSYAWRDSWGNEICRRFNDGGTSAIQGSPDNCPVGTHPWTDSWGTRTCKSFSGGQQYYDTSRGCPTGTYPTLDSWGQQACKRF